MELTVKESRRLQACEEDIERGGSLIVKGLQTIRDERLYRDQHNTFEEYCQTRWNLSKTQVNRLIQYQKVLANLTAPEPPSLTECEDGYDLTPNGCQTPDISERAAREIADLPPEKQREVVEKATANGKKPTAKAVKEVREQVAPKTPREQVKEHFEGKNPKPGKEVPSAKKFARELYSKHYGYLVRGIDTLAKMNGGKGVYHAAANQALNDFSAALKQMQEGRQ